jgi:hypothetical protein
MNHCPGETEIPVEDYLRAREEPLSILAFRCFEARNGTAHLGLAEPFRPSIELNVAGSALKPTNGNAHLPEQGIGNNAVMRHIQIRRHREVGSVELANDVVRTRFRQVHRNRESSVPESRLDDIFSPGAFGMLSP